MSPERGFAAVRDGIILEAWKAKHDIKGERPTSFFIPGARLYECPVGYITARSKWLLAQISAARHAGEHGHLYGPDYSRWPVDLYDAAVLMGREENVIQNERMKVLSNGRE